MSLAIMNPDAVLAALVKGRDALVVARQQHDVPLANQVYAQADTFERLSRRQNLGEEWINLGHKVKIEALVVIGELLKELKAADGLNEGTKGQLLARATVRANNDPRPTIKDLGVEKVAKVGRQLAALDAETREAIAQREQNLTEVLRKKKQAERRQERIDTIVEISRGNVDLDTPTTFPVIYADPPWRYEHVKTETRAIENQYPTMSLDEICALPVASVATPEAVLFLWATSPKLAEAIRVVEAWGFTYRTSMVWVKDQIGMGYYARQRHELLLIGTRGAPPVPEPANRPDSVVSAPRAEHSAKPPVFYEVIERMYPELSKIELFCRAPRSGWAAWGNQSAVAS